jgi:integrase
MDELDIADSPPSSWECSVGMLRAVVRGETYDAVATARGVTRTAVERRIKVVAVRLAGTAGIEGLNAEAASFVRRLRLHRDDVLRALDGLEPTDDAHDRPIVILSDAEIAAGAQRIRTRSRQPLEDVALYLLLFATAARPMEIARLLVRDYLTVDGSVRHFSQLRSEVTITGRARPLLFGSARLRDALDAYLADRLARGRGVGTDAAYRGLDPDSRLFLSSTGSGYTITPYGEPGQHRFECRAIWHQYRKLFRHAEQKQVTALTARHTVADRLYARGADEGQIGLLFGIGDRRAVREQFPRRLPNLDALTRDLV